MHLVVFDVDGTLTDSSEVEDECLWQAAREVLRLPNDHSPWIDDLRHVTDLCKVSQHCEKAVGQTHHELGSGPRPEKAGATSTRLAGSQEQQPLADSGSL